MRETRTATERLDALLAGLEDSVLETSALRGDSLEEKDSPMGVRTIRSDIEAALRTRGYLPTAAEAAQARMVKTSVAQAMASLERLAGVGTIAGKDTADMAVPRVSMAFSGTRSKKREQDERKEEIWRKGMPEDERGQSAD